MATSVDAWAAYAATPTSLRDSGVAVVGAGEHDDERYPPPPRTLPCFAAVYISRGSGVFQHGESPAVSVAAPAVLWLFPGRAHAYRPDIGGWAEHWVMVDGVAASHFFESRFRIAGVSALARPPAVTEALGQIRAGLSTQTGRGAVRASVAAQQFLLALADAVDDGVEDDDLLARFAEIATQRMTVPERAAALGMSYRELVDRVTALAGIAPAGYVISLRLSLAQELLASTDRSVSDVAVAVGVDDVAYFTRVFTQRVGVPPTRFRAEQRRLERSVQGD
ncbi:MAG: helix-turn-helix domain-containing protein [Microcella sp.]